MKRTLLASVAFTALLAAPGLAQEAFDLDEIVVSPSLAPIDPARTGATVEVVEGDDLQNADTSLIQTLSREPGVSFSANGGVGSNTTLRIRGLDTSYIGVRVNGIDVTDPSSTQTGFNFGGLTAAGLGRVEILKGSQSAIYGSEAIAGVVDITTARPRGLGFSADLNLEAGSFGTRSGSLWMGHATERGEVALSYSRLITDGISALASDTEEDGFEQEMLTLSTRYDLTDTVTVGASALWRDGMVEIDRPFVGNAGENFFTQRGARVFAEFETGGVDHRLSYSVFDSERRDPGGFTPYFNGDREELQYIGSAEIGATSTLGFGLDETRETFDIPGASGEVTTRSVFAELQLRPADDLDLSLALRHDDHSRFGGSTTGRIAAAWRAQPDLTLRAVLGSGFRAPSLYELFGPYGSATLQPEQSRSFELGAEKTFEAGFVRATAFYTEIDDLIGYDFILSAYNQQPGTTVTRGLELAGRYALSDRVALFANYTLTDAKTEGTRLVRVPRHDLVLGLDADLGNGFNGTFEVQRVADVEASAFAPVDNKVGDYTLVNLGVSYDITDRAQAYLRVENLLDEDYETAGGYNTPGRAAYFGLRASF